MTSLVKLMPKYAKQAALNDRLRHLVLLLWKRDPNDCVFIKTGICLNRLLKFKLDIFDGFGFVFSNLERIQ